jgi:hypothetical protein
MKTSFHLAAAAVAVSTVMTTVGFLFHTPVASAAPCANRQPYDVPCQNCLITAAQNPNYPRDLCYQGANLPPPQQSTGFPDCDAMPNAQQRVICADQHLTGQR